MHIISLRESSFYLVYSKSLKTTRSKKRYAILAAESNIFVLLSMSSTGLILPECVFNSDILYFMFQLCYFKYLKLSLNCQGP